MGAALAALLLHEPAYVTELDVGANPLGREDVKPLAEALEQNRVLAHLSLAACGLAQQPEGVKRLAQALRKNGDLLTLDVRHNGLDAAALKQLKDAAKRRPKSSDGDHEQLELRVQPQDPLGPDEMLDRSPRDDELGA